MQSDETSSKEQLSALVDGHLHGEDLTSTMARLLNDPQGRQAWHSYHVIGDVLRSSQMAPQRDDFAFLAKLEQRLAQVAVRPAFNQRPDHQPQPLPLPAKRVAADSANAPVWRWKMIAGLACTALLTVLGVGQWNVPGGSSACGGDSRPSCHAAPGFGRKQRACDAARPGLGPPASGAPPVGWPFCVAAA